MTSTDPSVSPLRQRMIDDMRKTPQSVGTRASQAEESTSANGR
jgi:hypothetical protein